MTDDLASPDDAAPSRAPTQEISWGRSFAELLGLCGFAFAQPILATFGADPGSFVTARASGFDIVVFALVVVLAPPTLIWVAERVVALAGSTPRTWFHRLAVVGLVALFFMQALRAGIGRAPALLVGLALGAVTAWLVARYGLARQFLGYLAVAPLLFLVLFFLTPVNRLLFPSDPPAEGDLADGADLPPVVMIVLDELPLDSLLDGDGNIDADAFPGLGALAGDATFARNDTTVSPTTPSAVPAILTGLYPTSQNDLATAGDHPRNLFTLLGGTYSIRAGEHVTHMCPDTICEVPAAADTTRNAPLSSLFESAGTLMKTSVVPFDLGVHGIDPTARFEWLDEFPADDDGRPTLSYLHSMLPHEDWNWLPDGQEHDAPNPPVGMNGRIVADDPATAQLLRQRHLLQTAYADRLVADTLDSLRRKGLYDDSLIIVTSDHGVSFEPGEPVRPVSDGNKTDIFWTPLLVKAPNQTEPRVLDTPTASIDILPTIVDLLDLDVDWDFDGRSIFGPPRPDDWDPHTLAWKPDTAKPADHGFVYADGPAGYAKVLDTSALDFGPDTDLRFWRWGSFGALVGEHVDDLEVGDPTGSEVVLDDPQRFESVDVTAPVLPLFVSGRVSGDGPDTVAVAVNGIIGGTFDTSHEAGSGSSDPFYVLVPPSLLHDGSNDIDIYLVETVDGEPALIPTV